MGPLCRNYTTHLVCLNDARWVCCEEVMSSDKVMAAREWGDAIRVVSVEWLLACVREWKRVSEEAFVVKEVNEDDVETGDEELEGNEELEGREELEGNDRLKANEDDVETGSEEDSDADKDEDQVVWEKLFDRGTLDSK